MPVNEPKSRATTNNHFEHLAQNVTVCEAAMAVLRKGGKTYDRRD
jgi:hypothetical protein